MKTAAHRDLGETVDALCRAAEQFRFLFGRVAGGQELERVPKDGIARTDAIRREIALKHPAVGAKRRDAGLDVRLVGARQLPPTKGASRACGSRTCRTAC